MAVNQNQNILITNTPYFIVATACTFTLRVKCHYLGFPGGSDGEESACSVGDHGSIPGSGRSLGEGNGYSIFLPGEFHGPRSLVGYSPWGLKESDRTEPLTLTLTVIWLTAPASHLRSGSIQCSSYHHPLQSATQGSSGHQALSPPSH